MKQKLPLIIPSLVKRCTSAYHKGAMHMKADKEQEHRLSHQAQFFEGSAGPAGSERMVSRRDIFERATSSVLASIVSSTVPTTMAQAADTAESSPEVVGISASWSAVAGINSLASSSEVVAFDASAYRAMRDDKSRTPQFQRAISERLFAAPGGPASQTVLDLGTGPFALFAIIAAEAGAGKIFAIEASPEAAQSARDTIKKAGFADVITVLEGFSTDVTLPSKVDLVVAEIVGSVASEEGAYASILDAHRRFVKEPEKASSWIPHRIQTYAAPASYTLHNLFGPPEFDWNKLSGEPVRFNCRDNGLQLLADPVLVEDISFPDIMKTQKRTSKDLSFTVDSERIDENTLRFYDEFRQGKLTSKEAEMRAMATSHSVSGIAFWPRLMLDAQGELVVNSRVFPSGGHQRSHWQTVLPIMASRPVEGLKGGDKIVVQTNFVLSEETTKAAQYRLDGKVYLR